MAIRELDSADKEFLVYRVIDQIKIDLEYGDHDAVETLLNNIDCDNLYNFLSEDEQIIVDSRLKLW